MSTFDFAVIVFLLGGIWFHGTFGEVFEAALHGPPHIVVIEGVRCMSTPSHGITSCDWSRAEVEDGR